MNFLSDFRKFYNSYPRKKIGVFFHTSFILESLENIKIFFEQEGKYVYSYIPENCVYELKILSKYSSVNKYREKASILLERCSTNNAWPYRSMYEHKKSLLSSYHCDVALFVFYEPAAAAEFSRRMGNQPGVFILSYDPYNSSSQSGNVISAGQTINRPCMPLKNEAANTVFKREEVLTVKDRNRQEIRTIQMSSLEVFHGGGESLLFKTDLMPGKILKIYKYRTSETMVEKLRLLITFSSLLPTCVLPTELLYRNKECVGFVMNQVHGKDLGCALASYNEAQRKQLIRDISVVLLELRLAQFAVTDLSAGNIHIGNDGKIRIIDCDSMEFYSFPGGGVTPPYGHPDVTEDYFYTRLRSTDHINFSYAVILFEILMGWTNPLLQKGLGDVDPQWKKHSFPYANSGGRGVAAYGTKPNDAKLKEWCCKPQAIRDGFVDVFNFRTTYDIGEWIKMIGIS